MKFIFTSLLILCISFPTFSMGHMNKERPLLKNPYTPLIKKLNHFLTWSQLEDAELKKMQSYSTELELKNIDYKEKTELKFLMIKRLRLEETPNFKKIKDILNKLSPNYIDALLDTMTYETKIHNTLSKTKTYEWKQFHLKRHRK